MPFCGVFPLEKRSGKFGVIVEILLHFNVEIYSVPPPLVRSVLNVHDLAALVSRATADSATCSLARELADR